MNTCLDEALPADRSGYSVEERLAFLEGQTVNISNDVAEMRKMMQTVSGDVATLVQITTVGKIAWKALMWLGAFLVGASTLIYMLLSIKGLETPAGPTLPLPHMPHVTDIPGVRP